MEVGAETFWRGFSSGRSSKWLATRAFWWFWFLQEMETSFRKKQTKCWCWDTRIMRGYSEMGIWDMDILWWISTYRRRQKLLTTFVSAIIRVQPASLLWPVIVIISDLGIYFCRRSNVFRVKLIYLSTESFESWFSRLQLIVLSPTVRAFWYLCHIFDVLYCKWYFTARYKMPQCVA